MDYRQSPAASYSLYADYYWYEVGDMICVGNADMLYYCFPKTEGDVAAKTCLAVKELYKIAARMISADGVLWVFSPYTNVAKNDILIL